MIVCAVSDLHGRLPTIPSCELLVIAGDICPDIEYRKSQHDPELMRVHQRAWLRDEFTTWVQAVPAERIIATPGNHDWVNSFPEEVPLNTEMYIDELVEWRGKRIYLTPWVSPCGAWNFQLPRDQRGVRFADIPTGLDLLVSHSPVHKCGDKAYGDVPAGCPELRQVILKTKPRFVVYGHIHEAQRYGFIHTLGASTLFNVAMWGLSWTPVVFEL